MDFLADILKDAGVRKRILHQRGFLGPLCRRFPCEKSLAFHVVLRGQAFVHADSDRREPIALRAGDVALMARGHSHVVSTDARLSRKAWAEAPLMVDESIRRQGPEAPEVLLISGAYQLWHDPVHPFFRDVPDWYVVKASEIDRYDELQVVLDLLSREMNAPKLGSESIVDSFLDVMFGYLLRRLVAAQGKANKTWSHAVQEPAIRRAVELMHEDAAHPWSLEELAKRAGLSRAGFAQKFKDAMGETPLQYLTVVRVQKAMNLLAGTTDNLESVAAAVGYGDAFGFSKVFKKVAGVPPKQFRARDRAEQESAWRFR